MGSGSARTGAPASRVDSHAKDASGFHDNGKHGIFSTHQIFLQSYYNEASMSVEGITPEKLRQLADELEEANKRALIIKIGKIK